MRPKVMPADGALRRVARPGAGVSAGLSGRGGMGRQVLGWTAVLCAAPIEEEGFQHGDEQGGPRRATEVEYLPLRDQGSRRPGRRLLHDLALPGDGPARVRRSITSFFYLRGPPWPSLLFSVLKTFFFGPAGTDRASPA